MQMKLEDIVIKKRIRRNFGDLAPLMDSLKKYGLMNPVVVNRDRELIAGHRRYEAARRLGWRTVSVVVVETNEEEKMLEMEIEENTQRKNLTSDELADAYLRLDRIRNPGIFVRIARTIRRFFRRLFRKDRR
jgi:ParB family chromosome partitioning protein